VRVLDSANPDSTHPFKVTSYSCFRQTLVETFEEARERALLYAGEGRLPSMITNTVTGEQWIVWPDADPQRRERRRPWARARRKGDRRVREGLWWHRHGPFADPMRGERSDRRVSGVVDRRREIHAELEAIYHQPSERCTSTCIHAQEAEARKS